MQIQIFFQNLSTQTTENAHFPNNPQIYIESSWPEKNHCVRSSGSFVLQAARVMGQIARRPFPPSPPPPPPTTHTNSHNFTVTRAECNKNVAVPRCAQAKKPPLKNPTVNTYPMPLHNDPYCRHVSGATVRVSLPQGVPGRVAAVRQQSEALGDDRARGDHLLPSGQLQVQVQTLGHEQI